VPVFLGPFATNTRNHSKGGSIVAAFIQQMIEDIEAWLNGLYYAASVGTLDRYKIKILFEDNLK